MNKEMTSDELIKRVTDLEAELKLHVEVEKSLKEEISQLLSEQDRLHCSAFQQLGP